VRVATERLSWNSATSLSSPIRWRQRGNVVSQNCIAALPKSLGTSVGAAPAPGALEGFERYEALVKVTGDKRFSEDSSSDTQDVRYPILRLLRLSGEGARCVSAERYEEGAVNFAKAVHANPRCQASP